MFAFLCRCRLVWCVILLIMLMPVWSLCLTSPRRASSPRCFPSSRFRTPHSLSSVAFRAVQISRLPFYFLRSFLVVVFLVSLPAFVCKSVKFYFLFFFFLLACCLLHGNCLCWGICGNKCNPYDPYDPTACIVVLRAQRVREGWIEADKETDGGRERRRREHPQARACEFCTECDLLLVFIVIFGRFTVS